MTVLRPGDEAALEAFLLGRLDASMFLLGNSRAAGLRDHAEPLQGTYVAAIEDGAITAVAAHYWNQYLILQAPLHAGRLAREAVRASRRPLGGILGPSSQVGAVRDDLALTPSLYRLDETEKLYSLNLDALEPPKLLTTGGATARRSEPRDLELLTSWRVAYSVELLNEEDTPALHRQCRGSVERYTREGQMWLVEVGGTPVACSAFNTATPEAVQVGGVWTPPGLRGKGYGRAVVAASLRDACAEGVTKGVLFTGTTNKAAQRAYEAIGFRLVGDYRMLLLKSVVSLEDN